MIHNFYKFIFVFSLFLSPYIVFASDFSDVTHYWDFNDSSLSDLVGSSDMTGVGDVGLTTGFDGSGLYNFTTNSYVYVDPLNTTSDFSLSMWVKISTDSGGTRLISHWSDIAYIYVGGDDTLVVEGQSGAGNLQTVGTFPFDSDFHHIVWTRSGALGDLYLDGTLVATDSSLTYNTGEEFNLGAFGFSCANCFIDEVGLWDRAFDSTDVTNLYNSGLGLFFDDFEGSSPPPEVLSIMFLANHFLWFVFGTMAFLVPLILLFGLVNIISGLLHHDRHY